MFISFYVFNFMISLDIAIYNNPQRLKYKSSLFSVIYDLE